MGRVSRLSLNKTIPALTIDRRSADFTHLPWYHGKLAIRDYLAEKNKDKKVGCPLTRPTPLPQHSQFLQVIEYTLFQPGWFLNYLAGTRQTAKHVVAYPLALLDHNTLTGRFAVGSLDRRTTYTTIADFVNIVAKAIDYEGEWPTIGGISGQTLSVAEELAIGEKVRGKFTATVYQFGTPLTHQPRQAVRDRGAPARRPQGRDCQCQAPARPRPPLTARGRQGGLLQAGSCWRRAPRG